MSSASAPPSLSRVLRVVVENPRYRRLFFAGAVSQTGDWFNVVALFSLMLELTGKGEAIAGVFIVRSVSMFLVGPIAGVFADRFSRRTIMVVADIVRAIVVAGFIMVHDAHRVGLAYALVTVHALATAFFEPAQLASVPNLVREEDIVLATAMENTLWSFSLAIGSALAGVVMLMAGRDVAFLVDSGTFALSAVLIFGLPNLRARTESGAPSSIVPVTGFMHLLGFTDAIEGGRYILGHARIRLLILIKGAFGLTLGGVLVLLTIFGEQLLGAKQGTGIAALWTARGIGSFLGPLIAWRLGGDSEPALRRGITLAYTAIALMYVCIASSPNLWLVAVMLAIANAGGSILWTYGAALQQLLIPDAFRGRVFAADQSMLTLTMSVSAWVIGAALDHGVGARTLMAGCGAIAVIPLASWILNQEVFAT